MRPDLPSLRSVSIVKEIERTFRAGRARPGFRLVHYSIQSNHAHLVVEAVDRASSARWFDGWKPSSRVTERARDARPVMAPVARPRTWLSTVGWRRHGLLDPSDVPGR